MKNLKLTCSLLIILCIGLISCQKDNIVAPGAPEAMVKNKTMNDKSGDDETAQNIADYINALLNNEAPPTQTVGNSLLNIEAGLNWLMTDFDSEIEYRTMDTIQVILTLNPAADSMLGDEALLFFNFAKTQIFDSYQNVVLPGSGDKIISMIDLVYDVDEVYVSGSPILIEISFGRITTGAKDDLEKITKIFQSVFDNRIDKSDDKKSKNQNIKSEISNFSLII